MFSNQFAFDTFIPFFLLSFLPHRSPVSCVARSRWLKRLIEKWLGATSAHWVADFQMDQPSKLRCLLYLTLLGQKKFSSRTTNEWNLPLSFNFLFQFSFEGMFSVRRRGPLFGEKEEFLSRWNISLMKINDSTSYAYFHARNIIEQVRSEIKFVLLIYFCAYCALVQQFFEFNFFFDSSVLPEERLGNKYHSNNYCHDFMRRKCERLKAGYFDARVVNYLHTE